MAKKKPAGRPIGHKPWIKDSPGAPQCTTCNETWPCKIWLRWTQTEDYERDERIAAKIREDIARWSAGLWAREIAPGPACSCGMRRATCHRHPERNPA